MRNAGRYTRILANPTQKVRIVSENSGTTKALSQKYLTKATRHSQICNDQQQNEV